MSCLFLEKKYNLEVNGSKLKHIKSKILVVIPEDNDEQVTLEPTTSDNHDDPVGESKVKSKCFPFLYNSNVTDHTFV